MSLEDRPSRRAVTVRRATRAAALLVVPVVLGVGCGSGSASGPAVTGLDAEAARGQDIARERGCAACHSADGERGAGPTWKGIWGRPVTLKDGTTATVDAAYVARAVNDPSAQVVEGFPAMPPVKLNDDEIVAITAYIRALGAAPGAGTSTP